MTPKFENKYRISSNRLANWDYGQNGAYFITICCKDMSHYFGHVELDEMVLNKEGKIAYDLWSKIPEYFPYVELANFQVMPNHMHGILIVNKPVETRFIASNPTEKNVEKRLPNNVETRLPNNIETRLPNNVETRLPNNVETRLIASLHGTEKTGGATGTKNPMLNENISKIVRWYKGRCTFEIRKTNPYFAWQSRFWDNIIRDSKAFENIRNYIENNPKKWSEDRFYIRNIL